MRFERPYDVFAILGHPSAAPPWVASVCRSIATSLNPLMRAARDRPAVRTTQLDKGSPRRGPLSFGRIGWNERGIRKWTHQGDGTLLSGEDATFLTCEAWTPSWTCCAHDGLPPDILFAVRDHPDRTSIQKAEPPPAFRAIGCLAVARDRGAEMTTLGRASAEAVADTFQSVLRAHRARAWGEPFGEIGFTDAINDLVPAGSLFREGSLFASHVSDEILGQAWRAF